MSQFGLGRGLDALIPRKTEALPSSLPSVIGEQSLAGTPLALPIDAIVVNDYQPRIDFKDEDLEELSQSIREFGIIQPLVVCKQGNTYRLIAGERRLRAAKRAGLPTVPAVIRDANEHQRAALAIIENIQRVNLNPIETALAYQRLMDEFNLTQEEIGIKMGKSRPSIANSVRLLRLHEDVQYALRQGTINEGHGKVIAGLSTQDEQLALLKAILERGMTVGDTTRHRQGLRGVPRMQTRPIDPTLSAKEELLRDHLGTKVEIRRKGRGGVISIEFYSDDELKGILNSIITN